jgi:hypothetical protein
MFRYLYTIRRQSLITYAKVTDFFLYLVAYLMTLSVTEITSTAASERTGKKNERKRVTVEFAICSTIQSRLTANDKNSLKRVQFR